MIKFRCEHCNQKIGAKDEHAGRRVKCPNCGKQTLVPQPEPELELESPLASALDLEQGPSTPRNDDDFELAPLSPPPPRKTPVSPAAASTPGGSPSGATSAPGGERKCPHCGKPIREGAVICINCGQHLKLGVSAKTIMRGRKAGKAGMAILASAGGAVLGGVIWGLIGIYTGLEVGYVALLVGLLAGLGVTLFTTNRGIGMGLSAAGLAFVGLMIGKLMIAYSALGGFMDTNWVAFSYVCEDMVENKSFSPAIQNKLDQAGGDVDALDEDDYDRVWELVTDRMEKMSDEQLEQVVVAGIAKDDEVLIEGVVVKLVRDRDLPDEILKDLDENQWQLYAISDAHYEQVYDIAENKLETLSDEQRRQIAAVHYKDSLETADELTGTVKGNSVAMIFFALGATLFTFGLLDFVFFGLALYTAFQMGMGKYSND